MTRAFAWIVLLLAATIGSARAERVVIGLAIPPGVTDGGMAAAAELGLFKAERIEPEYLVFQGAGALLPQIATGQVQIGLPLTEPVLASYQPGNAPLPVTFFYNANPYNGLEIAVLADGPVQTIADLKGRSVGVGALTWGTIPQTRSLLVLNGLHPGKDVDIVAVGVLGAGFNALRTGRVAALNFNEYWNDMLEQQGTRLRRLPFPPAYRRMISNAYVANRGKLKADPDLYARFGRVVAQGAVICDTDPRFCIEAFWRAHPEARPKEEDAAKSMADALAMVTKNTAKVLRDEANNDRVRGAFDLDVIREYVSAMKQSGEFASSDIPLSDVFSNALVPEFTKFDRAALVARVRAAR
jgi:NitT/TauT family transport system substrate-binding protein